MSEQSKKVALPAYLPKRLEAYKIAKGDQVSYILRDKLLTKVHDIEPWQFFILEVLPGCETYSKLQGVFEDRFARPITQAEIEAFFGSLADRQLLDTENPTHALLQPFTVKGYEIKDGKAVAKSHEAEVAKKAAAAPTPVAAEVPKDLPPGLNDAVNFDPRASRRIWTLFDPRPLLKVLAPLLAPLRHTVYGLPLLLLAAVMLAAQYSHLVVEDLGRLHGLTTLIEHIVFSMFTVNLLVTLTTAVVAYRYRATVSAFGISIFLGFLPRFVLRIGHVEQLTRRERMWLQAAPLMVRAVAFSLGMLLWYNTRDGNDLAAKIGLALAFICALDLLLVSGNPLLKSAGYHLLSAFLNEPHLRGKSYKALLNRLKGQQFQQSDSLVLAGYGLASLLFALVLVLIVVFMVGAYLQQAMLGGTALVLAGLLGAYLLSRTWRRFRMIEAAYQRSVQFDRWRKRTVPDAVGEAEDELPAAKGWQHFGKMALGLGLLVLVLLPYRYEPGGRFNVHPGQRQVITSDVAGVIDKVMFDGGETVKAGTVVATLSVADYQSQVSVLNARVLEQEAVIADLKARPKAEEVQLAQKALEVAQERERYSTQRLPRIEKMYKDATVSFEEFDAARREALVDASQVAEKQAGLDLARTGATPEQLKAAEARLQSLKEERDLYKSKMARASLRMPFDGNLLTLHLKEKLNSYLDRGQPFATVENTAAVTVEVEVPETDLRFVQVGARVRLRAVSFSQTEIQGRVAVIDRNITQQSFGTVVKVLVDVPNGEEVLRTGMTGHAKIDGATLPAWQAFTQVLARFFNVQVWAWIP